MKFKLSQKRTDLVADYYISAIAWNEELEPNQELLFTEDFYMAVPADSQFAKDSAVRLEDTYNSPYISLESGRPVRAICDQFCQETGFDPHIVYESDNPESVRNLIAAGLGIGFWPQYSWERPDDDRVRLLPIESPVCRRKIVVTMSQSGRDNPAVQEFHRYVKNWLIKNNVSQSEE